MRRHSFRLGLILIIALWGLQACGGFHLRGSNTEQPSQMTITDSVTLNGVGLSSQLGRAVVSAVKQSGGKMATHHDQARYHIQINNVQEGKYAAGYSRARQIREYSIFLKFNFKIRDRQTQKTTQDTIELSRTQLYDSEFALGKAEEEDQMRVQLRQDAARML
ncbi:MAG: LPS-assembly lipoprotein LptE, partial [bacterium]